MLPTGTLTFLFSDIEGSTRLVQALGAGYACGPGAAPGAAPRGIRRGGGRRGRDGGRLVLRRLPECARRRGGGRSRPPRPCRRTVAGRRGSRSRADGPAHGRGDARRRQLLGLDVHRAARIGAAAHGGQVLISDITRGLVAGSLSADLSLRDLGVHRLKDLDQPERLFQLAVSGLTQEFPPPRTLETPTNLPGQVTDFIGRKREVQDVVDLLRHSRLLTLTGPGGTGKTRLALQVASQTALGVHRRRLLRRPVPPHRSCPHPHHDRLRAGRP